MTVAVALGAGELSGAHCTRQACAARIRAPRTPVPRPALQVPTCFSGNRPEGPHSDSRCSQLLHLSFAERPPGDVLLRRSLTAIADVALVRHPIFVPRERGVLIAEMLGGKENRNSGSYHRANCQRWADHFSIPSGIRLPRFSPIGLGGGRNHPFIGKNYRRERITR